MRMIGDPAGGQRGRRGRVTVPACHRPLTCPDTCAPHSPHRHTLTVKRPFTLAPAAFGDLREDNLQLVLNVSVGLGMNYSWNVAVRRALGLRISRGRICAALWTGGAIWEARGMGWGCIEGNRLGERQRSGEPCPSSSTPARHLTLSSPRNKG